MAWTLYSNIQQENDSLIVTWGGRASDSAEAAAEIVVNKSDYVKVNGAVPTTLRIDQIYVQSSGCTALLEWDHTANDFILLCPNNGFIKRPLLIVPPGDLSSYLEDPASAGGTGDIVLTTFGAGSTDDCVSIEALVSLL